MTIIELQVFLTQTGVTKTLYNIENDGSEVSSGGVVLESTPRGNLCILYRATCRLWKGIFSRRRGSG